MSISEKQLPCSSCRHINAGLSEFTDGTFDELQLNAWAYQKLLSCSSGRQIKVWISDTEAENVDTLENILHCSKCRKINMRVAVKPVRT